LITYLPAAGRDSTKGLHRFFFIKIASENPFLWTGMKDASADSRGKADQMLKQVQHDITVRFWFFCHPELVSGSRFLV
jgi:hypothetical protein